MKRFWSKVKKTRRCWLWTASILESGYGQFGLFRGRMQKAHRVAWMLTRGSIPRGKCVLHKCDNPICVRPGHLFTGTRRTNNADRAAKGRSATGDRNGARLYPERLRPPRGEQHGMSKLRRGDVARIRRLYGPGVSQEALGKRFGVSQTQIGRIVRGERWA